MSDAIGAELLRQRRVLPQPKRLTHLNADDEVEERDFLVRGVPQPRS
jgi:hypothetical protein